MSSRVITVYLKVKINDSIIPNINHITDIINLIYIEDSLEIRGELLRNCVRNVGNDRNCKSDGIINLVKTKVKRNLFVEEDVNLIINPFCLGCGTWIQKVNELDVSPFQYCEWCTPKKTKNWK